MPLTPRRAAPWLVLALASVCYSCGSKSEATGFGSETGADTGSGEPGTPCVADGECSGACTPPVFVPDGDRACGPSCMVDADCDVLAAFDYAFEVPLASPAGGNNLWNSTVLSRGRVCESGHCQFLCPPNGAVVYGNDGAAGGCACLPHFVFDGVESQCIWDESVACSILERPDQLSPCDACTSEPLYEGCSSGRYQCQPTTPGFAGDCVDWAAAGEVDACAMGTLGYDCSPGCYSNCAAADCTAELCIIDSNACQSSCCEQTDTPTHEGCDTGDVTGGGEENTPALCSDGTDNDGDGNTDCNPAFPDIDCCGVRGCPCFGNCVGQGICAGPMTENNEATCTDMLDNDGDGTIDCDPAFPDTECCGVGSCPCTGACEGVGGCV